MKTNRLHPYYVLAAIGVAVGVATTSHGEEHRTWAERLGYPPGKKVLLLHADDIGMCFEANEAAKEYLSKNLIQSAAAMVPCPWFDEFADWYKEHPDKDVGLHLTLTSEWRFYRWGPTAGREAVPSLVDKDGYLHRSVLPVALTGKPEEVEIEIRAQIDRALSRGIKPGHIDTHMGTLYAHPAFTEAYLKVAMEYGIPAMAIEMIPERVARFRKEGYPITEKTLKLSESYALPKLDDFHSMPGGKSYEDVRQKFFDLVDSLEPGITEIIFHPSTPTKCLERITNSWRQRGWEARLFADPDVRAFLQNRGVLFTNWKEMMKRHRAAAEKSKR